MQRKKKHKKRRDFIQIMLFLCLLFLYTYYESKRKETAAEANQTIQYAYPEWEVPLANIPPSDHIQVRP